MGTLLFGGVLWLGDTGQPLNNEVISEIPLRLSGDSPLDVFVSAMLAHTLCEWRQKAYAKIISQSISPPGAGANVDNKAIIYYRDPVDLTVRHFAYPCPIAADVEVTSKGKRIKQTAVVAIVGYISTMTGVSYKPLYGVYMEKE